MQAIKSNVDIFILFQISEMDTDLKEEEAGAGANNEAKAGDVANEDVMDLELEGVTGGCVSRDRGWEQYECEGEGGHGTGR